MRLRTILILLALAVVAAAGWWWYANRPAQVVVVAPTRGEAAEIVYASGVVEPRNWAKVTSLVRERLVSVCNCEGSSVEKGDELARLDASEAEATLAELQARQRLAIAERDRLERLVERRVANASDLDRAESEVSRLDAMIAGQQARLASHVLRAPSDGVVLRQDAEVGEIAEPGTVLFWVGQPEPLLVVAEVNEEDIPRVEVGQRGLLRSDAFPGRQLQAKVDSITPKGDPVTKTYRVRLALPVDTPLLIGMSVDVNVVIRVTEDALLIPSIAVKDGAVFVANGDRAHRREVETGIRGTANVEILSGLAGDARVISPYPEELADGERIAVAGE